VAAFAEKFLGLWRDHGAGDAYPGDLFADAPAGRPRGRATGLYAPAVCDVLGFAAAKMIRRILGLAKVIDLEAIEDRDRRALCERRCLRLARDLMVNVERYATAGAVATAARRLRRLGVERL